MNPTPALSLTHPADIEREILRQIAAASASRTKASLFNLVIFRRAFARDPSAETLGYLLGRRPARLVVIESGTDGPSEAFVSARCHPDPRNQELCFQEIRIQNGSDGVGGDPGFWSPLLIRDIPVFVWWLESTAGLPEVVERIAALTDRFIADSGFAEDAGEDPATVLRTLAGGVHSRGVPCADFAWHRIHSLRLGTARLFDPPEARAALEEIRKVRLRGWRRTEALLFFFWLASRLGWTPARLQGEGASMSDARGATVEVEHERPQADGQTCVLEIELAGGGSLGLKRESEAPGCILLEGPGERREHLSFDLPSPGESLLREVDAHAMEPVFAEVLDLVNAAGSPEGG
ncbi:MAG: glucose-6-phosphate dehydrogenase assembly protein OpcA [Spirochaetales bacterium]|nr:glucose-6-phosphate dehydrogenase assembly protein OpcA [Spirochaetales bacterium]